MSVFPPGNDESLQRLLLNCFVTDPQVWPGYILWATVYLMLSILITPNVYYPFVQRMISNIICFLLGSQKESKLFVKHLYLKCPKREPNETKILMNAWFSLTHAILSVLINLYVWIGEGYAISDLTESFTLPEHRLTNTWELNYNRNYLICIKISIGYILIDLLFYLIPFQIIHLGNRDFSFAGHHIVALFLWITLNRFNFGIRSAHLIWIVTELGTIALDAAKITKDWHKFMDKTTIEYVDDNISKNNNSVKNNKKNTTATDVIENGKKELKSLKEKASKILHARIKRRIQTANSASKISFAIEFSWARLYVVPLMTYYSLMGVYGNPDESIPYIGKHLTGLGLSGGCAVGIYWAKRLITHTYRDLKAVYDGNYRA